MHSEEMWKRKENGEKIQHWQKSVTAADVQWEDSVIKIKKYIIKLHEVWFWMYDFLHVHKCHSLLSNNNVHLPDPLRQIGRDLPAHVTPGVCLRSWHLKEVPL